MMKISMMRMKINELVKKINIIEDKYLIALFLFLKPITDMFYGADWLDVGMLAFASIFLTRLLIQKNFRLEASDLLIGLWVCINIFALSQSLFMYRTFVKMSSIVVIYYIGKFAQYEDSDKDLFLNSLKYSFELVIIVNLLLVCFGKGFQQWDHTYTLSGMYYFKTDLACAMLQAIAVLLFTKKKWFEHILVLIAVVFIILSNARIGYVALAFILVVFIQIKIWPNKRLSFWKIAVCIVLAGSIGFLSLKVIASTSLGQQNHFLSTFSADDLDVAGGVSLTEAAMTYAGGILTGNGDTPEVKHMGEIIGNYMFWNTQGRTVVWSVLIEEWLDKGFLHTLFGGGYYYAGDLSKFPVNEPHSLYVGSLIFNGIIGIILFLIFSIYIIRVSLKTKPLHLSGVLVSFLGIVYICGISYTTVASTQYTWVVFLLLGISSRCLNRH